jgi:hypothetical protein
MGLGPHQLDGAIGRIAEVGGAPGREVRRPADRGQAEAEP